MSIFLKHPLADVFVGKMSAALEEGFNFKDGLKIFFMVRWFIYNIS